MVCGSHVEVVRVSRWCAFTATQAAICHRWTGMSRHIVFVTHELDPAVPGGAGTVVAGLVPRLRSLGHTVTVVLAAPMRCKCPGR